jgi:hypothetical protein
MEVLHLLDPEVDYGDRADGGLRCGNNNRKGRQQAASSATEVRITDFWALRFD